MNNNLKKPKFNVLTNAIWHKLADIKQKIANFDIKPAVPDLSQLLQHTDQALTSNDYKTALQFARHTCAKYPKNILALKKLLDVLVKINDTAAICVLLRHALKLYPNDKQFLDSLALTYLQKDDFRNSTKLYKRLIELFPDEISYQHIYSGLIGKNLPRASPGYIRPLFDSYANDFETQLLTYLNYQAPQKLASFVASHCRFPDVNTVIDLGCGTGLMGQELRQRINIKQLVGVDLSGNMIEKCREKNIYDAIHNVDLIEYLQQADVAADLIVSSDSLVYVGDFQSIFEHVFRILPPGGLFGFTVEKMWLGTYKLNTNGRYRHSLKYLKSLYKQYLFSKMYSQTIALRKEYGNMVAGYLVLLQK